MSDETRGKNEDGKLLYCSFCGKSQHEVRKLIAGPSVFICDECVELCNDIIREELEDRTEQRVRTLGMALEAVNLISQQRTPSYIRETLYSFLADYDDEVMGNSGNAGNAGNTGNTGNAGKEHPEVDAS